MANVNSLSSNSYNSSASIYGSRNVLSGLATGMDTETMIQNSVTGYQTKITQLQQQQTKIEWKQDAMRDLIDQMCDITQKYTSYSSNTNLSSNSFFNNARVTTANGTHAEAVSATGAATSDIKLMEVKQLATSARYSVKADDLGLTNSASTVGDGIDWTKTKTAGEVNGTLTLKFKGQSIDIAFDENDKITSAEELRDAITEKLKNLTVTTGKGSTNAASLVNVAIDNGQISFSANTSNEIYDGSSVYISGFTGNLATTLGARKPASSELSDQLANTSLYVSDYSALTKEKSMTEYLNGQTIDVNFNGTSKSIKIGDLSGAVSAAEAAKQAAIEAANEEGDTEHAEDAGLAAYQKSMTDALAKELQKSLNKEFGTDRVTVSVNDNAGLSFNTSAGNALKVASGAGSELGFQNGLSNVLNTDRTLGNIFSTSDLNSFRTEATGAVSAQEFFYDSKGNAVKSFEGEYYQVDEKGSFKLSNGEKIFASGYVQGYYKDAESNLVRKDSDGKYYRVNEKGQDIYSMTINGVTFGEFTKDSKLENVITAINSNADVGVSVAYSNLTNAITFTARELGAGGKVDFGDSGLANKLFASDKGKTTEGQDSVMMAEINGEEVEIRRGSNVVNLDGLTVTLKDTFKADVKADAVTFSTSSNSDDIVNTIKTFVEDVNKLMNDVHKAYTTQPLRKSSSATALASSKSGKGGYEPLTEEDKEDMSESAIKAYEEKAKTGILFGDTDLSTLYDKLRTAITGSGSDLGALRSIGITAEFSNGVTTLKLNEADLRNALTSDPDKVRTTFTKLAENSSDGKGGLMERLKTTLTAYSSTSLASPGILVKKAGTKRSALSLLSNTLQTSITNIDAQIESWQVKLSNKIDYYTKMFTQLEKLTSTMNNQSSMLADLMGY